MASIRGVRPDDLDSLYAICLATGDNGADAAHLHKDPKVVGHVYAAPYALLEPQSAFVAEDDEGVAGYIVGARDTLAFEARLEAEWWPGLRERYADPVAKPAQDWGLDEIRAWVIHHPRPPPARITGPYPSHLHINLLPRLQGQGMGKRLVDAWLARMREQDSPGVHLGVSLKNQRAVRFYRRYGFEEFVFPSTRSEAAALYFVTKL
ncbi:MAG: GNAT family N-acetyltransferase [Caulobacterales bacterium]